MSLPLLVAIVAVGIGLCVAAVHFTGGGRRARIADEWQARRRFAEDFPDIAIEAVYLANDGHDAFLDLGPSGAGIVHGVGDRFLTRIVARGGAITARLVDDRTVELLLPDFTWRGGRFEFAAAAAAGSLAAKLAPAAKHHEDG